MLTSKCKRRTARGQLLVMADETVFSMSALGQKPTFALKSHVRFPPESGRSRAYVPARPADRGLSRLFLDSTGFSETAFQPATGCALWRSLRRQRMQSAGKPAVMC